MTPNTTNDHVFNRKSKGRSAYFAKQVGPTCCVCQKTAIFRVGTKGYCRDHKHQAEVHARHVASCRDVDTRDFD